MNIASALMKQVLMLQDFETWSVLHKHYLPVEYHSLFSIIEKHCEKYQTLPSFDDLKYEIRDNALKEKLYAIEAIKVDIDAYMLLEYLKNEYTQKEILNSLDLYLENSVSFEDAEESLQQLHQIVLDVEGRVDLEKPQESMQRIPLFETDEDISLYLPLGLNEEYDYEIKFAPDDYILIGGKRGAGKSVTCANIANNVFENGKSAMYFTIEMNSRNTLQRCCAIATGIPFSRIRTKALSSIEWLKIAEWWASRFSESNTILEQYKAKQDFDKFHTDLTTKCKLLETRQLDIIYDPALTLSKIKAEIDKKLHTLDVGVIVVDYLNQVKRSSAPSRGNQYDWVEQIEVSKALKALAQEYRVPIVSPYQIDATGEARFAKGILDSADAAFTINAWEKSDNCVTLDCVKMRNGGEISFTSTMDWSTLKMGPESALSPKDREDNDSKTGEEVNDL